jgi:Domain of unknown function (DUF3331)
MSVSDSDIVWQQTLRLLCSLNGSSHRSDQILQAPVVRKRKIRHRRTFERMSRIVDNSTSQGGHGWDATSVTGIERRSDRTIAVSWADATFGHYGEQLWIFSIARKTAVCALTGNIVRRGDAVYRPRMTASHVPPNAQAMILIESLKRTYPERTVSST